jgi:hypothetical protein
MEGAMTDWPDYPEGPENLRHTAIHEAGHAVMAHRLCLPIHSVSLIPVVVDGIRRNGGTYPLNPDAWKEQPEKVAKCFLAAWPACLAAGVSGHVGRQDDMDKALRILWEWLKDEQAARKVYAECETCASEMMGRPENIEAVKQLANLLLKRKKIDGADVQARIQQSDLDLTR